MTEHPFTPDWTVPPGEILREWCVENDPEHTQLNEVFWEEGEAESILSGQRELTPDDTLLLACLTGISIKFWRQLEENYRADLIRLGKALAP